MSWIGSAISAGASFLGNLFSNGSQNKNIDKQIAAQKEENRKNRDYNLMLAQMQNAWNAEQWERENAYNDPSAQLARMQKAGINPDMAVGGGYSNTSASSPAMTAGAASTAQDMSVLGQRPTLGQAIQSALRDSMIGAQIDNIKADTRQKNASAGITEIQGNYEDAKQKLGLDISRQQYDNMKEEYNNLFELGRKYAMENEQIPYDTFMKKLDAHFKEKSSEIQLKKLSSELKISEKEAEYLVESFAARILGLELDNTLKQNETFWNSPGFLEEYEDSNAIRQIVSLLAPFLRDAR